MADNSDQTPPTYTAPGYDEKYSNNIWVESRLLDFRLRFGRSVYPEPGSGDPFMVEYFQAILISPEEAKFLAAWISDEVRRFEERFGAIPVSKPDPPAEVKEPAGIEAGAPRPN